MTFFRRLSLATTLMTLGVIGVGGLVRATGSGDGCPAWPKCFGRWIPPLEYHAIIEYSHRAIGAIAITLLVITAIVAVVTQRKRRGILTATLIATFMIFVQAALGAIVVHVKTTPSLMHFEPSLVTFHIATAMILIGMLTYVTIASYKLTPGSRLATATPVEQPLARLAIASAASAYLLILIGAYVRGKHAGLAFSDWPLMNGTLLPGLHGIEIPQFVHRAAALIVGLLVGAFALTAWRARARNAAVAWFGAAALAVFFAQAIVGGLQVWTKLNAAPVVAHVLLSGVLWASLVAAVTLTRPARATGETSAPDASEPHAATTADELAPDRVTAFDHIKAYVALTKPRIILLLLITTVPTMVLAKRGLPSIWLMAATVIGGTLAAGSANTINMVIDRDIDAIMNRTKKRPLPSHTAQPTGALIFGILLGASSFVFMSITVNILAALLSQSAILFYVFVYTLGLKRSTPQNIVIGGAAGAVPVLVAWAAVTGGVGAEAFVLFSVIFFWTPPHFWALAMRYRDDYASAGVPMMPVVAGARATQRQIVLYSFVTVAVTLALWPVGHMGALYLVTALASGTWFIRHSFVLWRTGTPKAAMGLFKYSISYLTLLFVAVGVDTALHIAT